MTTQMRSSGLAPSATPVDEHAAPVARRYLLTLCRLSAPIALPTTNAPQLKPYSFFMSRSRDRSGAEQLLLHIGYFATRAESEQCLKLLHAKYPNAMVSALRAPAAAAATATATATPGNSENASLTDTQVLRILETRRPDANFGKTGESAGSDISLVRPDDTDTRRALKEAVIRNAPVHFAVQLLFSADPIDLAKVPGLDIFRAYTLYITEDRREERRWFSLRLGFFNDAISARQVAHYVRQRFANVGVVPIVEQERERANESRVDASALGPAVAPGAVKAEPQRSAAEPKERPKPKAAATPVAKSREQTLEQTLEMLAASEIFSDADSLSETGVRHLSVTVKKRG
jgi:hypothetical protein